LQSSDRWFGDDLGSKRGPDSKIILSAILIILLEDALPI